MISYLLKEGICLDCKTCLNLQTSGHRVLIKNCPVYCNNWRFTTWDLWKYYLFQIYDNLDD